MAYFDQHGGRADRVAKTLRRTPQHELQSRWPLWRRNCDSLRSLGFPGYDVTTALLKGADIFHELDPDRDILPTWAYLVQDLGLKPHIAQKVRGGSSHSTSWSLREGTMGWMGGSHVNVWPCQIAGRAIGGGAVVDAH